MRSKISPIVKIDPDNHSSQHASMSFSWLFWTPRVVNTFWHSRPLKIWCYGACCRQWPEKAWWRGLLRVCNFLEGHALLQASCEASIQHTSNTLCNISGPRESDGPSAANQRNLIIDVKGAKALPIIFQLGCCTSCHAEQLCWCNVRLPKEIVERLWQSQLVK